MTASARTRPSASTWYSTPASRRHRVSATYTLPRALKAHVAAEAQREGIEPSRLVERVLVAHLGEPPPLPEERPGKENRPSASEET